MATRTEVGFSVTLNGQRSTYAEVLSGHYPEMNCDIKGADQDKVRQIDALLDRWYPGNKSETVAIRLATKQLYLSHLDRLYIPQS